MEQAETAATRAAFRDDMTYRNVQPWRRDRVRQSTVVRVHETVDDAFAEIDRMSEQMVSTGYRS